MPFGSSSLIKVKGDPPAETISAVDGSPKLVHERGAKGRNLLHEPFRSPALEGLKILGVGSFTGSFFNLLCFNWRKQLRGRYTNGIRESLLNPRIFQFAKSYK